MYYIDIKRATVKQSDVDCLIVAAEQAEPETVMRIAFDNWEKANSVFEKYKSTCAVEPKEDLYAIQYIELTDDSTDDDGFAYETTLDSFYPDIAQIIL